MTINEALIIARATEATGDKRTLLKMARDSASVLAKEVDRLQEENERLKKENDFVTCANCECNVLRSATKPNADGKPICIDNAVRSACGHMVIIERLKATLEMVLDGKIISNVLINVGEYDNCYAHIWHGDTHVGPYPTRLDAVLALADELGL